MTIYEFRLPVYWAPAIINGDFSGLSDEDAGWVNQWLDARPWLRALDVRDDDCITIWHDASDWIKVAECCTFVFVKDDPYHNEFSRAERMRDDMAADVWRDMGGGDWDE